MAKINVNVMRNSEKVNKKDLVLAKKYFKRQVTRACFFSIKNEVPDLKYGEAKLRTHYWLKVIYASYMLRTPLYSSRLIIKPGRLKNFYEKIQ